MQIRAFHIVFLAASLLLSCCTSSEKVPENGMVSTPGAIPISVADQPKDTPGSVTLKLLPEQPTVLNNIALHVSGEPGEVALRWEKNGEIMENQTTAHLNAGSFVKGDVLTIIVASAAGEVRAQTTIVNAPPRVKGLTVSPFKVHRGVGLKAQVVGEDPDGDPVSYKYAWSVNGEDLYWEDGPQLPGDNFRRGDRVVLQVTPHDGTVGGKTFQGAEIVVDNAPPKFVSIPSQKFQGMTYHYAAQAEDADGDRISYALDAAPPGMTIDPATGDLNWTVDPKGTGEYKVRIVAKDEEGLSDLQEFDLVLSFTQK